MGEYFVLPNFSRIVASGQLFCINGVGGRIPFGFLIRTVVGNVKVFFDIPFIVFCTICSKGVAYDWEVCVNELNTRLDATEQVVGAASGINDRLDVSEINRFAPIFTIGINATRVVLA